MPNAARSMNRGSAVRRTPSGAGGTLNSLLNVWSVRRTRGNDHRSRHQGRRGADRHRRRDHPHVGAALRLPGARAHGVGLPPLHRGRRRGAAQGARAAPSRAVGAGRDLARAGHRRRRPTIRRSTPRSPRRTPARGRRCCSKSTLVALSRAIEHEALALAAAPVVFGAFQQERFYRRVEPRYRRLAAQRRRGRRLRRLPRRRAPPGGRAGRDPDRPRRRAGQRVGGRSSTRPATPRACWRGSSRGSPSRAGPTTATAASRRSGRSTPRRRGAPRRSPRGWRRGPTRRSASGSRSCWPTGRWRSRSRRRRSPR